MIRYASMTCWSVLWLCASCGGRTSSSATGGDPGSTGGDASTDHDAANEATLCSAITIDDMEEKAATPGLPPGTIGGGFSWAMGFGNWFYDVGKDVPTEDIVPPRGESKRARRVDGFMGNGLLCQLHHPLDTPVDLGTYAGITFWARVASPGGRLVVTVWENHDPAGAEPFTQEMAVSDTWKQFDLPFDGFRQASSGTAFSAGGVADFDFKITGVEAFDLWIDDLALRCPSAP